MTEPLIIPLGPTSDAALDDTVVDQDASGAPPAAASDAAADIRAVFDRFKHRGLNPVSTVLAEEIAVALGTASGHLGRHPDWVAMRRIRRHLAAALAIAECTTGSGPPAA